MNETKKQHIYLFSSLSIYLVFLAAYVLIGLFYPFALGYNQFRFQLIGMIFVLIAPPLLSLAIEDALWGMHMPVKRSMLSLLAAFILCFAFLFVVTFYRDALQAQLTTALMQSFPDLRYAQAVDVLRNLLFYALLPLLSLFSCFFSCRARLRYHRQQSIALPRQQSAVQMQA